MTTEIIESPQNNVPATTTMNDDIELIRSMFAKGATDNEFKLLMYYANRYSLDILTKQIWFTKIGGQAQIYCGRDGYLAIAHRSGKFDGMRTVVANDEKGNPISAVCTVWRNDMSHPFIKEVYRSEYDTHQALWRTKPATMISKVAESQCLRQAFNICGLYDPSEMGTVGEQAMQIIDAEVRDVKPANPATDEFANAYNQEQFDTIVQQYVFKNWDTSVIKSAQFKDGWYNRKVIDEDFKAKAEADRMASQKKDEPKPNKQAKLE